jgi:hypothetical protein
MMQEHGDGDQETYRDGGSDDDLERVAVDGPQLGGVPDVHQQQKWREDERAEHGPGSRDGVAQSDHRSHEQSNRNHPQLRQGP